MAVPMRAPYVVSKYAVEGLCDCLRYEMRSWGVKVSIIEPGNFIAGTSIFSETSINDAAKTMWETMSDDVRSDYGREHFEARVNLMKKYAKIGRRAEDASTKTEPSSTQHNAGNRQLLDHNVHSFQTHVRLQISIRRRHLVIISGSTLFAVLATSPAISYIREHHIW
nr:D-beta-hydroxybutyrate dehydrogenase, mitochondrial-like [Cherax quadricarinatus]